MTADGSETETDEEANPCSTDDSETETDEESSAPYVQSTSTSTGSREQQPLKGSNPDTFSLLFLV